MTPLTENNARLSLERPSGSQKIDLSSLVEGTDYTASEVIVKFKPGIQSAAINSLKENLGASVLKSTKSLGVELWQIEGTSVADAIAAYSNNPLIEYIEPNYTISINKTIPNDPSFDELWGMNNTGQTGGTTDADIDAVEAWDIETGSDSVVVGVIDSGIDYNHPDLVNNMWTNPGEIADDGIDNDGNGYVDDYYGYDFANNDGDPFDDNSHGTHVAGTIAAEGNNDIGVIGVAPNTQVMALKFLNASGYGSTFGAIQSIEYATMMGVDLTNNSWGGGGYSQGLYDAIEAAGEADQLFIAAAGNSANDNDALPSYPASYDLDNIISVAATNHNDQDWVSSNFGAESVDLGAPGAGIYSTIPGGGYASYSGTSMATPHVSGVAALLLAQDSDLSALEVKQKILDSVDPIAALDGKTVTGGRLNAYNALTDSETPDPGPLNLGFETGDFTDWETLGNTNIETAAFGATPTEGHFQALLNTGSGAASDAELESFLGLGAGELDGLGNGDATEGAAIKLTPLTVNAGDVLSFNWNFLTNEGTPSTYNDFGFFSIAGNLFELADTSSDFVPFVSSYNEETGYGTVNYLFTESGTFDVGFGVVDEGDGGINSALLVDNLEVAQLNGSFETGDFTQWSTIGDTNIETDEFGSNPTEGDYQALITNGDGAVSDAELESFLGLSAGDLDGLGNGDATEGSAIQLMPITVNAGDILTFDWNFLTNEETPNDFGFNDFGFVSIASDSLDTLANTDSDFTAFTDSFNSETGYGSFSYKFAEAGTYQIGLGVADVFDKAIDSALLVDNLNIAQLNGSFETGDFTHWNTLGETKIETADFGSEPTEGNYQAFLSTSGNAASDAELEEFLGLDTGDLDGLGNGNATEGAAMQLIPMQVEAGDVLSFDWNFLTNEGTPSSFYNDFGFVSISSESLDTLANTESEFVPFTGSFNEQTGYGTFNYIFTEAATIEVGVGVVDVGDTSIGSGLLVDNFKVAQLNTSFEEGDFTHWDVIGQASLETADFGSNPTEGNYQALITNGGDAVSDAELEEFLGLNTGDLDGLGNGDATEGSAIQLMPITVEAGQVLNFDWNFLTNEAASSFYNDFGFVSISSDELSTLANTESDLVPSETISFGSETNYGTFTYEFAEAGTYQLALGVVDVGDTVADSGLLVDNVVVA